MKSLIVEDDFTSRSLLQHVLSDFGEANVAVNGKEAVEAVSAARNWGEPYDLVCLDIMMPEMDGQTALKKIRAEEEKSGIMVGDGVKILMITALKDRKNVFEAFREACDGYVLKPIDIKLLLEDLNKLKLL